MTSTISNADRVEIAPLHLSITEQYNSGGGQNVHLIENGDLGVILQRGQGDDARGGGVPHNEVPHNVEDTGLVVVSLGVDSDDRDEVHYSHRNDLETMEVLGQAIESLVACRNAVRRVTRP